jgi:hypothetical protein
MWKKIAAAGAVGAAILGAGGVAMAATSSGSATTPSTGPSNTASPNGTTAPATAKARRANRLERRTLHGTFVTKGKGNTFVTHDVARGTVSAISATSISVQTADGLTETYAVGNATKVRTHPKGAKGAASTISAVHVGDTAEVTATGTPPTATVIVDVPASATATG